MTTTLMPTMECHECQGVMRRQPAEPGTQIILRCDDCPASVRLEEVTAPRVAHGLTAYFVTDEPGSS